MIAYDRPAKLTALQAISEAQKIAFSPIAFHAGLALLRLGVLRAVAIAVYPELEMLLIYLIVIAVLVMRPRGLFGAVAV